MRFLFIAAVVAVTGCSSGAMSQQEQWRIMSEVAESRRVDESNKIVRTLIETNGRFLSGGMSNADLIESAKAAAAYNLKDPDSAKFRNVATRGVDGGVVVCGEINAKNSYGAYTGFTSFAASSDLSSYDEDVLKRACR